MSIIIKSGSSGNLSNVTASGGLQVDGSSVVQPVSISGTVPVSGSVSISGSVSVTGTFWQATQPVSAASLPLPANASQETGGNLATLAGAVVSGKIQANITNASIAVTGTFFQAVQPVSGTVAVSNFPATQPVSGTVAVSNFPATQPVSIASAVAVTGTFFQATQPVSGTVAVSNFPATQPVSIAATVATTQVGGASGLVGDVQTKGVQGVNALMVQEYKDSGRVIKTFSASFTAAVAEAMITLTPSSDGTGGATNTTFTVTAGKRFRIQAIMLTCFNTTAAIHACQVNLRMSASGAVTTASQIVGTVAANTSAATANFANSQGQTFQEGLELSGTMQFGISQIGIALAGQTVVLMGYEY